VEGQLLRADLDEFTPTVGHPPAETFPRTRDSELAMVQIVVELIPEFPQNGPDPRLGLVACDGGEVEFLGELWVEPEKGDGADDDSKPPSNWLRVRARMVAPCGEATNWGAKAVTEVVDRWRGSGGVGIVGRRLVEAEWRWKRNEKLGHYRRME
jgi:hypothetical protein